MIPLNALSPYLAWAPDARAREAARDASPAARAGLLAIWREIERRLTDVRTVLDVGAGVGRFSLELARRGFEVVHVERDPAALAVARAQAGAEQLHTLRFVRATLPGLGWLTSGVFDLVLCLDGAVSFAYPRHKEALAELVRVSRRWVIIGALNRLALAPSFLASDLRLAEETSIPPLARQAHTLTLLRDGVFDPDEAFRFYHPAAWPPFYAFHPEELRQALEHVGTRVVQLSAPGALAASLENAVIEQMLTDERQRRELLALAERYDSSAAAMGTAPRELWAGVLATARRDPDALLFRTPPHSFRP